MLTTDDIDKLRETHGEVYHLRNASEGWEIVFRRPARKDCKVWRALANDPARKSEATEKLMMTCVVYPTVRDGAFDKLLDRYPLLPENGKLATIIGKVTGMTGGELSDEEKQSGPSDQPSDGT